MNISLTMTLIITIAVLTILLFACANQGIKDRKQIKKLEAEIEKYKEIVLKYLTELALIKKDGAEIEQKIEGAESDEEIIDILGDIISSNNNRVQNNKAGKN